MHKPRLISTSKRRPCPICNGDSYCSFREDVSLIFCARIEEGALKQCSNGHYMHVSGGRRSYLFDDLARSKQRRKQNSNIDWASYTARDVEGLEGLAAILGVSAQALAELEVGNHDRAWIAPMFNAKRERIGIHRRLYRNGEVSKFCVTGSRLGLFMPKSALTATELFLPEGMTDTAALLSMGLCAAGRPSNSYGFEFIRDLIRGRDVSVAVVGDNDDAGRSGVLTLASSLRLYTKRLKVIYPPEGIKDAREWLQQGGDAAAVRVAVEVAHPVELIVNVIEQ